MTQFSLTDLDGIVDPEHYWNVSRRICWVLKEPNNGEGGTFSMKEFLKTLPVNKLLPRRVALVSAGLLQGCNDCTNINPYAKDIKSSLLDISLININKKGCGKRQPRTNFKKCLSEHGDLLFSQLIEADADVFFFGGTMRFFKDFLENKGVCFEKIPVHPSKVCPQCFYDSSGLFHGLFVSVIHPSHTHAQLKDVEYADLLIRAVREAEKNR